MFDKEMPLAVLHALYARFGVDPVGASLTCHFQLALTASAPANFPFTFGVDSYFIDPDPNNCVSVVLQRAIDPIPVLCPTMLSLLAALMALTAGIARRQYS